jgi:N-acetyl-S-(2-succino)cysteine monooxygenase
LEGACDGFAVVHAYYPTPVEYFVQLVIPELQRRGIFRTEYEGRTLRENLGLKFKAHPRAPVA